MRQYSVTVIRALSQCPGPDTAGGPPLELEFSVEAKSINRLVAGEHYSIDYAVLSNWITTSSFQVQTHDNGTLKTINASAENQTGEVLSAVAQTAFAVATLVAPVPGAGVVAGLLDLPEVAETVRADFTPSPPPPPRIMLTCSAAARNLLTTLKAAKTQVGTATAALTAVTDDVTRATRLGAETTAERARLFVLMEAQRTRQQELDNAKNALALAARPLTVSSTYIWPGDFGTRRQELPHPTADEMTKLIGLVQAQETADEVNGTECGPGETVASCVEGQISAFARLETTDTEPLACVTPHTSLWIRCVDDSRGVEARSDAGADGLFIRPPVDGRLVLCRGDDDCEAGQDRTVLIDDAVSIPQLGQLRFLPFRTRVFEKNQLALSLRADGSVEKFEIQNAAAARRAAEATASVAQQAVAFQAQRRTQRAANIAAARAERAADIASARADIASTRADIAFERAEEVALLQHDITLLTRQKELNLLLNPPAAAVDPNAATTATTAALQAEIALLQARLAYLRAEGELAEARADDDDGP